MTTIDRFLQLRDPAKPWTDKQAEEYRTLRRKLEAVDDLAEAFDRVWQLLGEEIDRLTPTHPDIAVRLLQIADRLRPVMVRIDSPAVETHT